jgi:predicted AlkP superfamily phosphohydrolase/phosphomutase
MFWRAIDPQHPLYTPETSKKFGYVIPDVYRQMDQILGYVMERVDDKTLLMVVSDHGFKSFRRTVHINSWLRDNGYLVFKGPAETPVEGKEFFRNVDWSRSRAYAVGLGSLYLNLKGREKSGIVESGAEAEKLKREIASKLETLKDQKSGQPAVRKVYLSEDVFEGEAVADAPDLVVGFEEGYRASWQTALGASPVPQIEDNLKKWSGDHILDHRLVPGVFFSNKKTDKADPTLYDLSPTLLSAFGLEIPRNQKGRALFTKHA